MRNLTSTELQHVYGGGKPHCCMSKGKGKGPCKSKSKSKSKSCSKSHSKSHSCK